MSIKQISTCGENFRSWNLLLGYNSYCETLFWGMFQILKPNGLGWNFRFKNYFEGAFQILKPDLGSDSYFEMHFKGAFQILKLILEAFQILKHTFRVVFQNLKDIFRRFSDFEIIFRGEHFRSWYVCVFVHFMASFIKLPPRTGF